MGRKTIDMTNQTVGKWTVVGRSGSRGKAALWLCECSCGHKALVTGIALRHGKSSSCRSCAAKDSMKRRLANKVDKTKPYRDGQLKSWARHVVKNFDYHCFWCKSEDNLHAHHILPKAKFPQYALDVSNGICLCRDCHITCHKQGGF